MNIFGIVKIGVEAVVATGAGAVVGNILKISTPENINRTQKILLGVGGFVLTSMVGDAAGKWVGHSIDEVATAVKNSVAEAQAKQAEEESE